jgi:hypothetical protein
MDNMIGRLLETRSGNQVFLWLFLVALVLLVVRRSFYCVFPGRFREAVLLT